jgi:dCTP deaminase
MLLCDAEIKRLAAAGMITPFLETQVAAGEVSAGVSSFGYDARVGRDFRILSNKGPAILDPKRPNASMFEQLTIETDETGDEFVVIPPHSFVLAATVETFSIPRNVLVTCLGKSTYARIGIFVNVTPLEPEWTGQVTLEFANAGAKPARIYVGEGACQFVFSTGLSPDVSYADRKGKYQGQVGVTLAKVLEPTSLGISSDELARVREEIRRIARSV